MLNKIVFNSLKKVKFLLVAVFFLFTLATMLLSLSTLTFDNLEESYAQTVIDKNYEDYRIFGLDPSLPGYDAEFETKFEADFDSQIEKHLYTIENYDSIDYSINEYQDYQINQITVIDGTTPVNPGEIFIPVTLAELKSLKVGDTLTLDQDYTISGIGYIPQYTVNMDLATGKGGVGSKEFFGVYLNEQDYANITKNNELIYYSAAFNSPVADEKELFKQMTKKYYTTVPAFDEYGQILLDDNYMPITQDLDLITFVMDNSLNFPLTGLENEITGQQTMFKVMSIVVTSIALMLTIVLFNNIFKTQKREIGILKAEGITNKELATKYTFSLFMILASATLIGFCTAYLLRDNLASLILTFYSFPITALTNDVVINAVILNLALVLVVTLVVYLFAIVRNLKLPVLSLIKNIETEKLPRIQLKFLAKRLSFVNRYKLNILLRNLSTTFILIFGVFVSSFLLLLGVTMYTAISQMASATYGTVFTYNYEATYSDPTLFSQEETSLLKAQANVLSTTGEGKLQDNSAITLYGFDSQNNEYINLQDPKSKAIEDDAFTQGIVLSKIAAVYLSAAVGDVLTIENPYHPEKEIDLEVTEISNDGSSINAYVDLDTIQSDLQIDDNYVTGIVTNDNPTTVTDLDAKATITDVSELQAELETTVAASSAIVGVNALFAMTISFIALVTISSIVITHNRKTISVMKVLGYSNKEITTMTTSVYKWIVAIVYFVSIPLFQFLIQFIVDQAMKDMDFAITINIDYVASILAFVVIYITYYISMLFAKRSINKIKLSESLKLDQ